MSSCPEMVLGMILPPLWSGYWRPVVLLFHGHCRRQHQSLFGLRVNPTITPCGASAKAHSSGCASSLHPSRSVRLRRPSGTALVLCRSSGLALQILFVTLACRLSVSALRSTTTCSAAVGRPPGVVRPSSAMAPPSISSTMGRLHGSRGLGPAWLLLLQVLHVSVLALPSVKSTLASPVSSMAPPSVVCTLDSVRHPPPGGP